MACAKPADMGMPIGPERDGVHLVITSDPLAVRAGLANLLASPLLGALNDAARGTAEIVLAEVLNNIVEHAYADISGDILITLCNQPGGVVVDIHDQGHPFPQETLPQGTLPKTCPTNGLPEGGFGWFLIRSLVQNLTYRRDKLGNHLSFILPTEADSETVSSFRPT